MSPSNIKIFFGVFFLIPIIAAGQFTDNFSDGDFLNNPNWTGNITDWQINPDGQLQSNNTVANANFYLSTANAKSMAAQWDFWVRFNFNPSGANYTDVYLTASQSNLTLANTAGYFIRLGDTPDEISLYRKDGNGSSVKIIDGTDGVLNTSSNTLRIRVTRDANNNWTLLRNIGGLTTGTYVLEGTAMDATYSTSSFFGIWVRQSTASFFQKHFFDDFEVKDFLPDNKAPEIVSANAVTATMVELLFDEAVTGPTASNTANYSVNNSVGGPITAVPDPGNPQLVQLTFANAFPNGVNCQLTVNGVSDLAGNVLNNGATTFSYYTAQRYDIVINELMVDPAPQVGLPNANWVELKNTSHFPINIGGYRLNRGTGSSGPIPGYVLQPDSFVIVCTGSAVPLLSPYGATLAVTSFPTLPNDGETIWLTDGIGKTMHTVSYNKTWYQNVVKAEGGWALEMVDSENPCTGAGNWRASNNPAGGTPGKANSVAATNPDPTAPFILGAFAPDAHTIQLTFNEPLDSTRAALSNYSVNNGIGAGVFQTAFAPDFSRVQFQTNAALLAGAIYTVTVTGAGDCSGNIIGTANTIQVGLASTADSLDLVVNEVLFNPVPQGFDYIELFNRGGKILNAATILLTNRSASTGNPGTPYPISAANRLIFPGEYYVVTANAAVTAQQFTVQNPGFLVEFSNMPSLPDDKGTVLLLNNTGRIIDELAYDQGWHFALISNREGVALERIDPEKPTQNADNWTSAAQSAGLGTPTYLNSQYKKNVGAPDGNITLNPAMFSPDNDGFEDFTLIEFKFSEPGYVGNLTIYDAVGRPVRVLQRNTTLAASGSFRWDGLNDKQQRVPVGNYIVLFEAFNLQGQKQAFKKAVTVARKF